MSDETPTNEKQQPAVKPILELIDFSYSDEQRQSLSLQDVNLTLYPKQLATIQITTAVESRGFVSTLQGLREPAAGRVLFDGSDWFGDDYARIDAMRSRIGRVFEGTAWIENLNIYENVTLSEHYHTTRSIEDIDREVNQLAKRFGIDSVTTQRPSFVGKTYLRICEWVRAFLGSPQLLLLENPMRSVPSVYRPKLVEKLMESMQQGAAAIWISRDNWMNTYSFPLPARHFAIRNQELVSLETEGP